MKKKQGKIIHIYTKTQLRTGKLKPSLKSYNRRIEKFKKSSSITPEDILLPEFCTRCRSEAPKPLCLKGSWSDFDPEA